MSIHCFAAAPASGDPPSFSRHTFPPASMRIARACIAVLLASHALAASANGPGENANWQFQTSADKANQAVIQDMLQKRRSGYYAAPTYTTTIARQYNCNVTATAQGNQGTNSTVANSPSNSGAAANSTGNANSTQVDGAQDASAGSLQGNSGTVGSSVDGATTTSVHGVASQALNSDQVNHGNQTADVGGSSACAFGALN